MKRLLHTLAGVLLVSHSVPAQMNIRLNEVHLNPPNPDDNYEFIELKSTTNGVEPLTNLSIIIINNDKVDADTGLPKNLGQITEVYSLTDLSTGLNGLLLLGNGYTGSPRGGPWSGFVDPSTNVADPLGMGDSDINSNDGLSIFLVSGLTAARDQDVDLDDDNLLDWADPTPPAGRFETAPWTVIIDSIGTRDRGEENGNLVTNPYVGSNANISQTWIASPLGNRDPDTMARQLGNNSPGAALSWYGGKVAGTTSTSVSYQVNRIFGPGGMLGEVTPGRPNLAATLPPTSFRINEVGLNPNGQDMDRFQYIEIINTSGAARNLNGYWLIVIDSYDGSAGTDDDPGGGRILEKWDLSSMATGNNGLLLIGNGFSSSYNSFNDLVSPQTGLGDPTEVVDDNEIVLATGFGEGDVRYKRGLTLLLVQNFIDPAGPADDLDAANDGVADLPLTTMGTIVDQVGFDQVDKTGLLGATYSTVNLRTVMPAKMEPDNLSRKAGDLSVGAGAWYGGEFDNGSPGFNVSFNRIQQVPVGGGDAYDPWFGGFRGAGTPGLANLTAPVNPASPPVASSVRISEVMFNPTNSELTNNDSNNEYIELLSTNGGIAYLDGLWIIVVDLEGSIGAVVESFPLDGSTSGVNGITILGDNYDSGNLYPYSAVDGSLTPFATAIDPISSIGGDDLPNDGLAVMVLRGPKTGAGNLLTLSVDGLTLSGDLDPENDGTLVAPSAIAEEVIDSLAVAPVNPGAGYGWISTSPFRPHHAARYPSNTTPNSGAAWYYGQVEQAAAQNPFLAYTANFAGTFKGAGSPGRPNHSAPTGPTTFESVVFNELHVNPPGADNNFEFIEIADRSFRSRSLNGYYIVMFDNVGPNTGTIRHFWSLDGMATGENGLLLLGNGYPLGGDNNPWNDLVRPQTNLGDPPGRDGLASSLSDGSLGDETDNLNVAFLLVRGFNKSIGFDLDEKVGAVQGPGTVDSPGDGQFDGVAWSGGIRDGIHDSIMFRDSIATVPPPQFPPPYYPWDGFDYALGSDLTTAHLDPPPKPYYHPESFARFPGEMTPNNATVWYGGDLNGGPNGNDGNGIFYITAAEDATHPPFPNGFTDRATPGQPNLARNHIADADGDGIPTLIELALNSNPAVAEGVSPLPVPGTVNVAGVDYATITHRRIKGGTTVSPIYYADGYSYTVEVSTGSKDGLDQWTTGNVEQFGTPVANPDDVTESVTFRLNDPVTSTAGRAYMRLRIGRQ